MQNLIVDGFSVFKYVTPDPPQKYGTIEFSPYGRGPVIGLADEVIQWLDENTSHEVKLTTAAVSDLNVIVCWRVIHFEDDAEAIHFKMRWF